MGNSYIDEREKDIQKLCEGIKQMNVVQPCVLTVLRYSNGR